MYCKNFDLKCDISRSIWSQSPNFPLVHAAYFSAQGPRFSFSLFPSIIIRFQSHRFHCIPLRFLFFSLDKIKTPGDYILIYGFDFPGHPLPFSRHCIALSFLDQHRHVLGIRITKCDAYGCALIDIARIHQRYPHWCALLHAHVHAKLASLSSGHRNRRPLHENFIGSGRGTAFTRLRQQQRALPGR